MNIVNIDHVYSIARNHSNSDKALFLLQEMAEYSRETFMHVMNVSIYAYYFGEYLGFSKQELELIFDAALVHDLGKLKTPLHVLHKPEQLLPIERQVMNEHVKESYNLTKDYPELESASMLGGLHHERWDGNGYPFRLKGDEIPYGAQVLAIVDAWDAMVSNRSYRRGMNRDHALKILLDERDSGQFNPELVDKFTAYIETAY